jgi:TRAP transporter TAXI family solute receptor
MDRRSAALTIAGLFLVGYLAAPASAASDLGIMTGGDKGTYYQFGLNLQRLAARDGVNLSVYTSKGSIENVYAVYQKPATQLGIVQSDVLAFVARVQSDPVLRRIAKKTKMVFPLYNEEIHILARPGISEFDDLSDRRVAIGREGSGTYLTARLLFNVADVTPRDMVLIDTDEALAELKAGRIDAMFYVAGYPVKLFSEGVQETDALHLVPILNKSITEFYPRAEVPGGTYAWQPKSVETVAVKSVLISFDFRRRDCDVVGKFAKTLSDNMDWLVKNGHPKWKAVDLNFPLKGWDQYDCVRKYLGKPAAAAPRPAAKSEEENPVIDAIKQILGD